MPRPRLRREPCDCLDCRDPAGGGAPASASAAIARQEPPPKSLVLCLTHALVPGALEEAHTPHLDALVGAGWAGLLACRAGGPPLPLQLLGLPAEGEAPQQSLPDRFKQLRAVLLTDSPAVAAAGSLAGCYAVHQLGSEGSSCGSAPAAAAAAAAGADLAQPPAVLAAQLCRLLQVKPLPPPGAAQAAPALAAVFAAAAAGGQGGQQLDEGEEGDEVIDMLLLCLDAATLAASASGATNGESGGAGIHAAASAAAAVAALEWADDLLRALNQAPGFRQTVLTSLVLGPGHQPLAAEPLLVEEQPLLQPGRAVGLGSAAAGAAATAAGAAAAAADCPAVLRPLQSYQFLGQEQVAVDGRRPALVVHRLPAVIRVDRAARLDLAHVAAAGGAGAVLAERLLPEVAYKLGRAPKYGA